MIGIPEFLIVAGMFVLRIGVPLALIVLLGYLLKRLDRRWEKEARADQAKARPAEKAIEQPARVISGRGSGKDIPGPQMPFDPLRQRLPEPGLAAGPARPCWEVHGCSQAQLSGCPAHQHPDQPCWQARFGTEQPIPDTCVNCEMFQRHPLA